MPPLDLAVPLPAGPSIIRIDVTAPGATWHCVMAAMALGCPRFDWYDVARTFMAEAREAGQTRGP